MNKDINLAEMLKNHIGETFYSTSHGNIVLAQIENPIIGYPLVFYFGDNNMYHLTVSKKGAISDYGECVIFPSKEQRDWNKWYKDSKKGYYWDEYCKINALDPEIDLVQNNNNISSCISVSAIALYKILTLINHYYGGLNQYDNSYTIVYNNYYNKFRIENTIYRLPINFSSKENAEKFLSNEENIKLLKEYFMM